VPYGHKFALIEITAGQDVIKYGEVIGRASQNILPGDHTHIHNIESKRGRGDLEE
jgi:altronate dehydratase small subunit